MKHLLIITLLLITSTVAAEDYSGNWRGIIKLNPQANIVLGFQVQQSDDSLVVLLDSPNQGLHDHEVSSAVIEEGSITIAVSSLNATFTGKFKGETLVGTFHQDRAFPITLTRLSSEQSKGLDNETSWYGDLNISKSKKLPLTLHVAVGPEGYHVTLDSPAQNAFSLPISKFSLKDKTLAFTSKLINASYQGEWQDDEWHGTFVQGLAMPLVFKRTRNH
jgi:hypothetical protein